MFSTTSSPHSSDDKQLGLTACHFLKHVGAQYDVDLTQPGYESRLAYQLCANDEDTLMLYVDSAGPDDTSALDDDLLYSRLHDRILELARYAPSRQATGPSRMNPLWFSLRLLLTSFCTSTDEPALTAQLDELVRLANVTLLTCSLPVYPVKIAAEIMRSDLDPFPLYLKPFVAAIGESVVEILITAHHAQHGTRPPAPTSPPTPIDHRAPTVALVPHEYWQFWQGWIAFAQRHLMVVFTSVIDPPDTTHTTNPAHTSQSAGTSNGVGTADPPTPSLLSQPVVKVLRPLTLLRCPSGRDSTATTAAATGEITVRISLPSPLKPFSNKYKSKFRNLIPQLLTVDHVELLLAFLRAKADTAAISVDQARLHTFLRGFTKAKITTTDVIPTATATATVTAATAATTMAIAGACSVTNENSSSDLSSCTHSAAASVGRPSALTVGGVGAPGAAGQEGGVECPGPGLGPGRTLVMSLGPRIFAMDGRARQYLLLVSLYRNILNELHAKVPNFDPAAFLREEDEARLRGGDGVGGQGSQGVGDAGGSGKGTGAGTGVGSGAGAGSGLGGEALVT